jgi:hypothetical protein
VFRIRCLWGALGSDNCVWPSDGCYWRKVLHVK